MMERRQRERKFTVDTNLYVRAWREPRSGAALERFHAAFAPFEYLTSIVAHELRVGVPRRGSDELQRSVFAPFERRGRLLAPSYSAWKFAAAIIAELLHRRAIQWPAVGHGFVHDVLLAVTCREAGITLVTENLRDFDRIAGVTAFDYVAPWPEPAS